MGSAAASSRWASSLGVVDRSAVVLSNVCALHCALTPLLVSIAPFLASEGVDAALRRSLLAFGIIGVGFGCWLHRNLRTPVPLGLALVVAAVVEIGDWHGQREILASLVVSGLLILAHTLNASACAKLCDHCSAGHWWADRVLSLGKRSRLSAWALPLSAAVLGHSFLFTLLAPSLSEPAERDVAARRVEARTAARSVPRSAAAPSDGTKPRRVSFNHRAPGTDESSNPP